MFVRTKQGADIFALGTHQRKTIPVHTEDHQTQTRTQISGNDIHKVGLPAMGVEEHQFFDASGSHTVAHIGPQAQDCFRFEGQGARKTVVFRTKPHGLGWQK